MDQFANAASTYQNFQNLQQPSQDGTAWWLKWLIKGASLFLGFLAIVLGFVTALTSILTPLCIVGGILLIFCGVLVMAMEVPICCSFVEFLRPLTQFSEGRPHWQKCVVYTVPSVVVIILCPGVASIFGALCILIVAGLYFMLAIGKKAPLEVMRTRATTESKTDLTNDPSMP